MNDINNKYLNTVSSKLKKVSMILQYTHEKIIENQEIKRLVYYSSQNPLSKKGLKYDNTKVDQPDLTEEDVKDLITLLPFNPDMKIDLCSFIFLNTPSATFSNGDNVIYLDINIVSPAEYFEITTGLRLYEISNKKTLGITENEIIQNIKIVVEKVIKQERAARRFLANEGIEVEDVIYRNYGILTNCKKITMEEAQNLLSTVKLGVDLGILKELSDLQIQKLYLYIQPGNLQKYFGEQYERLDREMKRAEMIKQVVSQ